MAHAQFDPKAMVDFDSLWPRGLFPDVEEAKKYTEPCPIVKIQQAPRNPVLPGLPPAQVKQQPSQSRRAGNSRARGRSQNARSLSASAEDDSDVGLSRGPPQQQQHGPRRHGQRRKNGGLPDIGELDDTTNQFGQVARTGKGAVDTVGKTAGALAGGGGDEDGDDDMGDKPLKLRLDLNLDVAVELKARVHGDLTLSLL
ncbi:hypothetical protein K435DRAFT_856985 [Dendrothele bispora CBS 962.96]|uniref:Uncharacterized protein n=1 Tax=Dendrothele bispora (strain CBS 962.96) TaxID=1314807 RepID=A0A4S8M6Z0_DENBC|nr:hypothetical protein K435DRAFT_856985 [Dendrothele bispora CBS 962.96]